MIIKYMTTKYSTSIEEVECSKETDKFVWVDKFSHGVYFHVLKVSGFNNYHDTWDKAYAHLLFAAEMRRIDAKVKLISAQEALSVVQNMVRKEKVA
jgi:hypothetical protein